jgi:hypothetical protein
MLEIRLKPTPWVNMVMPSSGTTAGGTLVTVYGGNFTGTTVVDFGATPATNVTVNSDAQLTATAPAESAGTVDVTVTNADGTSPTSSLDRYTFFDLPAVTGVSPNQGPTTGGQTISITGVGFSGATAVDFGTISATFTVNSSTQITATAPAWLSPSTVDVTVQTPYGTSSTSSADQYTYLSVPTVSSLSPSSGPTTGGTTVIILGMGFTGATAVTFGSTPASFAVVSDNEVEATAPSQAAGIVDVEVATPQGTSAPGMQDQYTFLAAGPNFTWTGALDENWSNPGNWLDQDGAKACRGRMT